MFHTLSCTLPYTFFIHSLLHSPLTLLHPFFNTPYLTHSLIHYLPYILSYNLSLLFVLSFSFFYTLFLSFPYISPSLSPSIPFFVFSCLSLPLCLPPPLFFSLSFFLFFSHTSCLPHLSISLSPLFPHLFSFLLMSLHLDPCLFIFPSPQSSLSLSASFPHTLTPSLSLSSSFPISLSSFNFFPNLSLPFPHSVLFYLPPPVSLSLVSILTSVSH